MHPGLYEDPHSSLTDTHVAEWLSAQAVRDKAIHKRHADLNRRLRDTRKPPAASGAGKQHCVLPVLLAGLALPPAAAGLCCCCRQRHCRLRLPARYAVSGNAAGCIGPLRRWPAMLRRLRLARERQRRCCALQQRRLQGAGARPAAAAAATLPQAPCRLGRSGRASLHRHDARCELGLAISAACGAFVRDSTGTACIGCLSMQITAVPGHTGYKGMLKLYTPVPARCLHTVCC